MMTYSNLCMFMKLEFWYTDHMQGKDTIKIVTFGTLINSIIYRDNIQNADIWYLGNTLYVDRCSEAIF